MLRTAFLLLLESAAFAADPTFTHDIAPILSENCSGCHLSKVKMGGLNLETYDGLMEGGSTGKVIAPGDSKTSRLYLMITGVIMPAMPMNSTKLPADKVELIRAWIDAGAKAPAAGETAAPSAAIPNIKPLVGLKPQIFDLSYSPDGKLIALAGFQEVRLLDPTTKRVIAELTGHADAVRALAFSRDGSLLAAAGGLPARSGEVKIWDVGGRKLLHTINGHADCIFAVAFSPDGKTIATSSYDKLIKLWDIASGKEIRTFKDHIDAIYALAFTPDGQRLISGAADRTIKIWSVATGERLYTLSDPQDGINTIALDPTGKYVAAGGLDKTIRIWELGDKSAKLTNTLIAHEDAILRLAWSPDGKRLLSSSADRTVKLFNAADLSELGTFPQSDWVYGLQWSPDGKTFAVGQFDGSLKMESTHENTDRSRAALPSAAGR
jgi:uncharacterized protein with WD repeat